MNCIFIGDVVGNSGCLCLEKKLPLLKKKYNADFVCVNGENSSKPNGISKESAQRIFSAGADVITTGNHVWFKHEMTEYLDECEFIIRPANYPEGTPGKSYCIFDMGKYSVAVINLLGCVYMESLASPFETADKILKEIEGQAKYIFVDFHAEATSEKIALGYYLDGRVSGVFGTHTHVQTADLRILEKGTAYITDLGMTGVENSVLGVKTEIVLKKFLTKRPVTFVQEEGEGKVHGVFVETDNNGKAIKTELIEM
ncbi:MAG: TIGR00282 family metallophosphoesterase [Ruminococcaceae bacterium]|nr:TIGR00282 family metallophosphoesterase [Oscillospiraceae bacterium]